MPQARRGDRDARQDLDGLGPDLDGWTRATALVESDDAAYLERLADDFRADTGDAYRVRAWQGCEYFLGCTNAAAGTTEHPVLPPVPTCERCAAIFDLCIHAFID